jgi:Diguanylate cyclase, GGDEF domain
MTGTRRGWGRMISSGHAHGWGMLGDRINRLLLEEILDLLTQEANRTVLMSSIMIDLDHFKRLND